MSIFYLFAGLIPSGIFVHLAGKVSYSPKHIRSAEKRQHSILVQCTHYTLCYTIIYSISSAGKMRLSALIPVVLSIAALILSFLCLFAGSKKGFMDSYAVVTVSTLSLLSRISQSILTCDPLIPAQRLANRAQHLQHVRSHRHRQPLH